LNGSLGGRFGPVASSKCHHLGDPPDSVGQLWRNSDQVRDVGTRKDLEGRGASSVSSTIPSIIVQETPGRGDRGGGRTPQVALGGI
jgi:hypothetical protein